MDLSQTNGLETFVVMGSVDYMNRTPITVMRFACGPIVQPPKTMLTQSTVNPIMYAQRRVFDWLVERDIPHHFTVIDHPCTEPVNFYVCLLCVRPEDAFQLRLMFGVCPVDLTDLRNQPDLWEPNA